MLDVKLSKLLGSTGGFTWNEMGHLHEVIGNDINGVKAMGQR